MRVLLFLFLSIFSIPSFGQTGEFTSHTNGMIYSDTTMKQLAFIVDSLNLKFKTCDLNKTYYSKAQTLAHYISLDSTDATNAKLDLENNISWNEFIKKYPQAIVEKNLLVVKFQYADYEDKEVVLFSSIELGEGNEHEIRVREMSEVYHKKVKDKWIYEYWGGEKGYSNASIYAFYFIEEFSSKPLSESYARMVQYSDCMVDTTVTIFKEEAYKSNRFDMDRSKSIENFFSYINKETKEPKFVKGRYKKNLKLHQKWQIEKIVMIDTAISKKEEFKSKLNEAILDALKNGGSEDEFEWYVGRYYSKRTELELKRSRIVVGGCSQDGRPREHAMNIAVLSAETINWEVFLRAHLDIMNDRFERLSDGSYTWAERKTYIRELEELDIDVSKLMFGISFRVENASQNHYYGSIGRLGRALSETKNGEQIETQMLQIIKDTNLDDYNRILMYYLFLNYNYYLLDEVKKKENINKLKIAVAELPEYLKNRIKFEE